MAAYSARSQLCRLLQLILALQANRFPNARRLAEVCEVSTRTIYRDLETLTGAGFPVRYEADRQGYYLPSGFVFQPPELDENEARAVLLHCQGAGADDPLGLQRAAQQGAWKLIAMLDPPVRERVRALGELVCTRAEPFEAPAARRIVYERLIEALASRVQVRIWFCNPEDLVWNSTKVSPYRLVLDGPRWYLIGRSTLHRDVKVFLLSWVRRLELTDEKALVPPRFDLARFVGRAWRVQRGPKRLQVWLRFSPRAAPEIEEHRWHSTQRVEPRDDGGVDLHLDLDGGDEVLGWILSFGEQVEVIAPAELRRRVQTLCERMAALHQSNQRAGSEGNRDGHERGNGAHKPHQRKEPND